MVDKTTYVPIYGVLALGRHFASMEDVLAEMSDVNEAEKIRRVEQDSGRWLWVKVKLIRFDVSK